jgi:SAM-dependent methyltransferase
MDKITNYWLSKNVLFFNKEKENSLLDLYKEIVSIMKNYKCENILDYGCGSGLLELNTEDIFKPNYYLYDINPDILDEAKEKLSSLFKIDIHKENTNIKYHGIIFCLVDICIKENIELINIYQYFNKIIKSGGILCIGTTHPCFRDEKFYGFETSFTTKKQNFEYFKNQMPFEVYYGIDKRDVQFIDYHRTLSFTINTLIKIGFEIIKINEIKDKTNNNKMYSMKSPFILYVFKKC